MLSAPYAPARRSQRRRAALVLLTAPASSQAPVSATLFPHRWNFARGLARLFGSTDGASGDPGPSPQRGGGAIDAGSCPSPAA